MGTVLDPRLSGFNAALASNPLYNGQTYQQYGTSILQDKIDEEFLYATDTFYLQQEETFGKLDWSDSFVCRITHVLSDKSTGEKLGDDFRNLIFQNMNTIYGLGYRYYFNENFWITCNTDTYKYPTASVIIRRCNNVLKNYDSNGVLHTEPCIIDYQIRKTDFDYNANIILPEGHVTIIVQGNDWTKTYHIDQRFMFGGQSYKCTFVNNFQRVKTSNSDSVNIIRMILNKDPISPDDDTINDIPNSTEYIYGITINQDAFQGSVGGTGTITANVTLNGELVSKDVEFISSDITKATIGLTTGAYNLIANGTVVFTARIKDNPTITDTVSVTITATVADVYQVIISPNETEIYELESQTYSAFLYKNNVQQVNTMTISANWTNTDYYTLTVVDGNHFTILNKKPWLSGYLVITCTSGSYSESISISLKGVF